MSDAARGIRASVIVLGYNGRRYLDAAISSLLDQDMPADQFEVIYVDNDSADGSADHVAEHFPDVRVIRLKENLGFYGAFDLAAADAAGVYLVADQDERVLVAFTNTTAPGSADYHPKNRDASVSECTWVGLSKLGYVRLEHGGDQAGSHGQGRAAE